MQKSDIRHGQKLFTIVGFSLKQKLQYLKQRSYYSKQFLTMSNIRFLHCIPLKNS